MNVRMTAAALILSLLVPSLGMAAQGDFFPSNQSNLRVNGITGTNTGGSHPEGTGGSVQFNLFRDSRTLSSARGYGGTIGAFSDERDFVSVKRVNGNQHTHGLQNLQVGEKIAAYVYVHNNATQICGGGNYARNTQVSFDWSDPARLVGSVSASNATPGTINDIADLSFAGDYRLEYANKADRYYFGNPDYDPACGGNNDPAFTSASISPSLGTDTASFNLGSVAGSYGHIKIIRIELVVVANPVPLNPNIDIDKDDSTPGTPDTDGDDSQTVENGGTATFTITVTNNGEVDLTNVRITDPNAPSCVRTAAQTDPLIRAIGNRDNIFNVGESFRYTCNDDNVTDAYTNLAQVTGTPVDGQPDVVDSDTTEVLLMLVPRIDIDKDDSTPGTVDTDGDDFQQVFSGNTATFTITVTNSGPVSLENVIVNDPLTTSCARTASETLALYAGDTFDPGESFTYQCTKDNVTEGFRNVADVSGISVEDGTQVVDEDPTLVEVPPLSPVIDIDKDDSTPGTADSDGDDTQTVNVGGVATFTIKVTNVGNENLRNIVITDPNNPACDRTAAQTAPLIRAQGNGDNILNAGPNGGESFTYTCTDNSVAGPYINTANVVGIGVTRGDVVTDTDPTTVNVPGGENPSIDIDKDDSTPGTADSDGDDTQTVRTGGTATFTIKVTNDGNVGLERVSVGDPLASNCALTVLEALPLIRAQGNGDDVFDPNESFTYSCVDPNVTASYTNTANTLGFSIFTGSKVTDNDPTEVVVADPNPMCTASDFNTDTARPGDTVTYTWDVKDVPTNATLMCSGAGVDFMEELGNRTSRDIEIPAGAQNGDVLTCKISMPDGTELCSDTVTITTSTGGNEADIQIDKNDQDNSDDTQQINRNGTAQFTITVTNTGDIALRNVVVTDPRAANCERDAAFTAGQYASGATTNFDPNESFTYTCEQGSWNESTNTALVVGTPINGDTNVTDEDPTRITFPGTTGGGGGGGAPVLPTIGVCGVSAQGAAMCQARRVQDDPSDPAFQEYNECINEGGITSEQECLQRWANAKGLGDKLCARGERGTSAIQAFNRNNPNACNPIIPPIVTGPICKPAGEVCPECFKQSENIAINKRVVGSGMVAKGGKVKYQIDLTGLETDNEVFRINSLTVRVHDRLIPAESGWLWGRGTGSIVDGDGQGQTWSWNDDAEYFTQTFGSNSNVIRALNSQGALNDAARRDLQVHYDLDTDLAIEADEAKLTNVAFAMLEYTYDVRVPDGDGGYTWLENLDRTMGVGNACDIANASQINPNNFHNVLAQDSTLGSQASIRIIRPFVQARGGNIAVTGSQKVTGETHNIQGAQGHQTIVESGTHDIFDGFDFGSETVDTLKDQFQSGRDDYFENLSTNMVAASAPTGMALTGSTIMTHNYDSGVYVIRGGDVVIDGTINLSRASTFLLEGANLIIEGDVDYSDHFAAFVLRPDDNGNVGNIYIDKSVANMDGVYIVEANANRDQGRIMAYGSQVSENQLVVNGNLIGDLSHLLAFRKFIGDTAGQPQPSLIVTFDLRILESTPPILEQFLGDNWREEVSQ